MLCLLLVLSMAFMAGCLSVSTPEEMALFEQAGPYVPRVDFNAIVEARRPPGPYRVGHRDILQFDMPTVMRALSLDPTETSTPHLCRVNSEGKITLPMVGEIEAAQKTLDEIETAAVKAYHPRFTVHRPAIVATVKEHSTVKVTVTGAVKSPGIYDLSREEQSLVGALMKAGGIVKEGAGAVSIFKTEKRVAGKPLVLPVEGMNIPFADVALEGGETIEVLRLNPEVFTVVGLVMKQGTFPYPAGARYNLLHAIGFGGGVDVTSDPHFVHVLRQDASGEIVSATFDISGDGFKRAASVAIKQGDIIAVADTYRTLARRILSNLIRGGFYVGYNLNKNN